MAMAIDAFSNRKKDLNCMIDWLLEISRLSSCGRGRGVVVVVVVVERRAAAGYKS